MLSIELSSCCLFCVFSQRFAYFFLVNWVKKLHHFVSLKKLNLVLRFSVNGFDINNLAILLHDWWLSLVQNHKILPNLVNSSWLWWITETSLEWIIISNKYHLKNYFWDQGECCTQYQKLQLVPRSSWIMVQQSVNFAAQLMSSIQYRKIPPNLVNNN